MRSIFYFSAIPLVSLFFNVLYAQEKQGNNKAVQRPQEVEFDARVIQGQRAEGAVYLFQRAPRDLPSLLRFKKDNLSPMIEPIFGKTAVVSLPTKVSSPTDILDEKNNPQGNDQGASKAKEKSKRKKQKKAMEQAR